MIIQIVRIVSVISKKFEMIWMTGVISSFHITVSIASKTRDAHARQRCLWVGQWNFS